LAANQFEDRLAVLEAEVAPLKARVEARDKTTDPWIKDVWGAFANDPDFLEAMRRGWRYRESLRPKPPKRRKRVKELDKKEG
jgi:hypothetical protein